MTPSTKPVTRRSSAYFRDRGMRPIIVTITGSLIELRLQGLRTTETVDVASLYGMAIKARLAAERAAKRTARKGKS